MKATRSLQLLFITVVDGIDSNQNQKKVALQVSMMINESF